MQQQTLAFSTPVAAPRWQRWLLFSPPARIAIFVAWLVGFMIAVQFVFFALGLGKDTPVLRDLAQFAARALVPLAAYLILVKQIERRPLIELAPRTLLPQGLLGVLIGLVLFSAVVAALWLAGSYRVEAIRADAPWLGALLVVGLGAGIGEEIVFRGVLFRIVEEGLGTWWALAVSALLFGAVHIANPGATLWSSAAIAIEAGLLFGLLYHVTRSLPVCMGVHAAWNFAQGTIYGIPVSGSRAEGWLVSTRSGPDWLSGGVFGAEASVVALGLCLACAIGLLYVARRHGSIVPPIWRRR
ncbi:CPBP family intramembrane glutamic endopeptidase [Rhodanobacter sp. UC4450_H17]